MPLLPHHLAALDVSISPARMSTYLTVASNDQSRARELYLWDRDLSEAFLGDLAILEVALRNAMSTQLARKWGSDWYKNPDVPLDNRSERALNKAWKDVKSSESLGKVVAQCMFGFWKGLLDRGAHSGVEPRHIPRDYDQELWRGVLHKAFPGGKACAAIDNATWNQAYARDVVSRVNWLRNRVAHHEPLVNGMPLPGQKKRMTAEQAHEATMKLAAMLDRDLHGFLQARSRVTTILARKP